MSHPCVSRNGVIHGDGDTALSLCTSLEGDASGGCILSLPRVNRGALAPARACTPGGMDRKDCKIATCLCVVSYALCKQFHLA